MFKISKTKIKNRLLINSSTSLFFEYCISVFICHLTIGVYHFYKTKIAGFQPEFKIIRLAG